MRDTNSPPSIDIHTCPSTIASPPTPPPVEHKPSRHATTPPNASDTCGQKNVTKPLKLACLLMPISSFQRYHKHNFWHSLSHKLQNKSPKNAVQKSPTPAIGGGVPSSSKRRISSTPMAHGSQPITISRLTQTALSTDTNRATLRRT